MPDQSADSAGERIRFIAFVLGTSLLAACGSSAPATTAAPSVPAPIESQAVSATMGSIDGSAQQRDHTSGDLPPTTRTEPEGFTGRELVRSIDASPDALEPDGTLRVNVDCIDDPSGVRDSAEYGWVLLTLSHYGHEHQIAHRVSGSDWPNDSRGFSVDVELREQLPPGLLTVTAACHEECCGYVTGPSIAVVDYSTGPSILLAQPIAVSLPDLQAAPDPGDEIRVDAVCPAGAGVGNGEVRLLSSPSRSFSDRNLGEYKVESLKVVTAEDYRVTEQGDLAMSTLIQVPLQSPTSLAAVVSCVRPRTDATPGVQEFRNGLAPPQPVLFDVNGS